MSTHTVTINGIDLVYEKEGSGPPVVFLHGGNQSAVYWEAVLPYLMSSFTCYALEQRGHGRSGRSPDAQYSVRDYANEAVEFLRRVSGPAVLVGHSQGGHAAFGAAASAPELVRAIYSEDCIPQVGAISLARKIPLLRAFPDMGRAARQRWDENLSVMQYAFNRGNAPYGSTSTFDAMPPDQLILNARSGYNTDPAWFDEAASIVRWGWDDEEAAAVTRALRCPVHLARGNPALGGLIREEALTAFESLCSTQTRTDFGSVGHVIAGATPREFINDLKAFLGRLPQ